jgi:hypothetical protein
VTVTVPVTKRWNGGRPLPQHRDHGRHRVHDSACAEAPAWVHGREAGARACADDLVNVQGHAAPPIVMVIAVAP